jgi:uroporphyrinogen decarboxylase
MTPRERILAALDGRTPDRLPVDFAGTDCSTFHAAAYDPLRKALGIEPRPIRIGLLAQQAVDPDVEVLDAMGGDVQILLFHPRRWRLWDSGYGFDAEVPSEWRPETMPDGSAVVRNAAGAVTSKRAAGGLYFDPVGFPLKDAAEVSDLDRFAGLFARWDWPTVMDETPPQYAARARRVYQGTDRAVVACWRMHYLQAGQLMRGYEQFMVDLLADEPMVRGIFDRLHAAYMRRAREWLDLMADWVDVIFFTDDLGGQQAPLIGPPLYRRLIKPYWAELVGLVKGRGKRVLMHTCGAVSEFIGDLIEIGVDAVNPVQITAAGMEPARLVRDFGRDITFWGGGVSTQGTLDTASPDAVAAEVRRNLDAWRRTDRYVFTQVHNIQAGVPAANVLAAFRAAGAIA